MDAVPAGGISCFSLRLFLFLFQSEINLFYVDVIMWAEMATEI